MANPYDCFVVLSILPELLRKLNFVDPAEVLLITAGW